MSRTKYVLKAVDAAESVIEGTPYWPDPETGLIEVYNPDHVAILKRHGWEEIEAVSISAPARILGLIDVDELGATGLRDALLQRGVEVGPGDNRTDLAVKATMWNRDYQQSRGDMDSASRVSGWPTLAAATDEFLDDLTFTDLKAWLMQNKVTFNDKAPAPTLRKIAKAEADSARKVLS